MIQKVVDLLSMRNKNVLFLGLWRFDLFPIIETKLRLMGVEGKRKREMPLLTIFKNGSILRVMHDLDRINLTRIRGCQYDLVLISESIDYYKCKDDIEHLILHCEGEIIRE